ncbi:MAG: hypothetical protein IKX57_03355 [Oscillospiraceae bacterium]|nr:hypothetical protein [Oscillospiraceae bacterium]
MTLKERISAFTGSDGFRKAAPVVCAMLSSAAFARFFTFSTAQIFTLLFALVLIPMFRAAMQPKEQKVRIASVFCGVFFTLATFLIKYEWLTLQEAHAGRYSLIFVSGFMLFYTALSAVLFERLHGFRLNTPGEEPPRKKRLAVFFGSAAIMFFCWLPYFLMLFPGDLTWDSIDELNQAAGNFELSNHHPIAQTVVIKFFYSIGKAIFEDDNRAVATYCVAQMLMLAFAFSYLIVTLYRMRVKKLPIACVLACYALLSYNGTYSTTVWKDIPFAILVLSFSVTLWRILIRHKQGAEKMPLFEAVMLFLTGTGVCLFRSNGMYAYMLLLLFLVIFCVRLRQYLLLGISCAALVIGLIVKGPVYNALGIKKPETLESLAMPQQMIGAVLNHGRELSAEQLELISHVGDIEGIKAHYYPQSADGIKCYIWDEGNEDYIAEHKGEFLKLWIDLGKKYPQDYLIALLHATYGYWYPDVQNWVYASEFRSDNFQLYKDPKLSPEAAEKLKDFREQYHEYYFLGLFWSIGTVVWVAVFMMGAAYVNRKFRMLLIFLPAMGIWGTLLIAAPVYAEFRYMYSFFSTLPLLCAVPFVSIEGLPFNGKTAAAVPAEKAEPEQKPEKAEEKPADAADEKAEPEAPAPVKPEAPAAKKQRAKKKKKK